MMGWAHPVRIEAVECVAAGLETRQAIVIFELLSPIPPWVINLQVRGGASG